MIDTTALRKRIIDLAVTGKLSEHSEGNASDELQCIIAFLNNKSHRTINKNEKWADIPDNWTWSRLVDLTTNDSLNDGDWVLSEDMVSDGPVKLIQLGSIGDCSYRYKGFKYLTEKHYKELNCRRIFPGYLLINRLVVDKMLACIIPDIDGILITAVDVCWVAPNDDIYDIEYLMYAMTSSGVQQRVKELGHGVTRFRISKMNLVDIAFPLPPLKEQKKIVKKIDQLFNLLETIDSLQQKYTTNLEVLKGKIIDAGICGKLTAQLSDDGNADDLYAQIQEEKEKLIEEGKIKKEKSLPEITDDEIPFEIPDNWKWCRLESVFNFIDYRGATPKKISKGVPFVTAKNVRQGFLDYSVKEYISEEDYMNRQSRGTSLKGDLLFTTEAPMGYAAIADLDRYSAGQRLITLQQYTEVSLIDNRYYMYCIAAGFFQKQLDERCSGTTVKGIKADRLKLFLIPLPPLCEQKRIARTIEAILEQIS